MSVVCAACKTENRDNAMFCRGCAGKLPGFAATGPAALDTMESLRPAPAAGAGPADAPDQGILQLESRAFWIRLGLMALAITFGFVGWYAYVTRRASPPAVPAVVAPTAATVSRAQPVPVLAPPPPVRPSQVPMAPSETLSPGETLAPSGAAARAQVPADVFGPRNGANHREPAARRRDPLTTAGSSPVRAAGGVDPRPSCAHLNFIAAARCEAAQCGRAEYRRHPHCDAVREQTRRDEARRNLPN